MRRPSGIFTLAALAASIWVCGADGASGAAQQDTPSWDKGGSSAPKPKPKPAPSRPRPRPTPRRPLPPRPTQAPLEVEYRVVKVNENNSQVEVSPVTVFNRGDRLRLAVRANQDVYLFVVHQKSLSEPGRIFVPDSQYNSGQNFLPRGQEFVFPSACARGGAAYECSHLIDGSGAQESFTLIFSRAPSVTLLEDPSAAGGTVRAQALADYVTDSARRLGAAGRGATIFSRSVRSLNPQDDRVAVRFMVNKRG